MKYSIAMARAGALGMAVLFPALATVAQDRPLSTDRPDKTESAFTVPAGRWQVESDLVNWTRDKEAGVEVETLSLAAVNIKYGVSANTDLQVIVTPYTRIEAKAAGAKFEASGFDDVSVRLKHNLFGNDGGKYALALMPFVTLPTAEDDLGNSDDVTGGLIVPLAIELGDGIGAGLMAQVNMLKDSNDDYAAEWVLSGTIGVDLSERFGAYGELYASRFDDAGEKTLASFDAGVTYSPKDDLQFDAGANVGLNDASDDIQLFLGVSRRW